MTNESLNTKAAEGKGDEVGSGLTRVEELVREANYYAQEAERTGLRTYRELAGFAVRAAYEQAIIDLHSPAPAPGKGEALGRTLEALKSIACAPEDESARAIAEASQRGEARRRNRELLAREIRQAELSQARSILDALGKLRPDEILTVVNTRGAFSSAIIEASGAVRTFRGEGGLTDSLAQAATWIGAR